MAHAGLRGKVHDLRKPMRGEKMGDAVSIGEIEMLELKRAEPPELAQSRAFEARIVIGIEIVNADDGSPALQQPARDMKTDKPGCAGDEDGFG